MYGPEGINFGESGEHEPTAEDIVLSISKEIRQKLAGLDEHVTPLIEFSSTVLLMGLDVKSVLSEHDLMSYQSYEERITAAEELGDFEKAARFRATAEKYKRDPSAASIPTPTALGLAVFAECWRLHPPKLEREPIDESHVNELLQRALKALGENPPPHGSEDS